MRFVPFTADRIQEAGKLFASRHRGNRALMPALPIRYENESMAALTIETEWNKPGITGAAAVDGGYFLHCSLGVAATRAEHGGRGMNHALMLRGFSHGREKGYLYCKTDWRMTNLQASRYWPRQGFRPAAYRVTRFIDQRIAWARG